MRIILTVALLLLAATRAWGDEAEERYKRGITKYDLAEYDEAIVEFKAAYEASRAPALLFNIAQAYRLKGDCEQALRFYRNYLRLDSQAANRADVETEIEKMQRCVEVSAAAPQPDEPRSTVPPTRSKPRARRLAAVAPAKAVDGGRGKRLTGLVTMGVGVALVATGVYFGLDARAAAADITGGSGPWDNDDAERQARGQRAETLMFVTGGAGLAAIAGGVVLYVIGRRDVTVVPAAGGVAMGWSCAF